MIPMFKFAHWPGLAELDDIADASWIDTIDPAIATLDEVAATTGIALPARALGILGHQREDCKNARRTYGALKMLDYGIAVADRTHRLADAQTRAAVEYRIRGDVHPADLAEEDLFAGRHVFPAAKSDRHRLRNELLTDFGAAVPFWLCSVYRGMLVSSILSLFDFPRAPDIVRSPA